MRWGSIIFPFIYLCWREGTETELSYVLVHFQMFTAAGQHPTKAVSLPRHGLPTRALVTHPWARGPGTGLREGHEPSAPEPHCQTPVWIPFTYFIEMNSFSSFICHSHNYVDFLSYVMDWSCVTVHSKFPRSRSLFLLHLI